MLLGGVTKLSTMTGAMQEGFDFIALGRGLIRQPDLVRQLEAGASDAPGIAVVVGFKKAHVLIRTNVIPAQPGGSHVLPGV